MQVGLIGAGNMARALARGWGDPVLCSDGGSGRARQLAKELGGEALPSSEVATRAELVVLCHKPAQLETVSDDIAGKAKAVASVLAGVPISALRASYPDVPIFRVMPNTPVEVRRGVICLTAAPGVAVEFSELVGAQFERVGSVIWMEERLQDAATAVMGVGPAYQAMLAEAQIDAGVRHGLAPAIAARLVVETMAGTASLLEARGHDTLAVRREVTSPGGATARGLAVLERAGIRSAFHEAADAVLAPAGGSSR